MYVLIVCVCVCVCVCMCVCVCEWVRQFPSLSQPYQRLAPPIPLEFTGEYTATARSAAVTRVRGGANLKCTSQLREIFSHPLTMYRQLKVCVQSLLDRLCKHSKFQVRFRPDKPDHSLVRLVHTLRQDMVRSRTGGHERELCSMYQDVGQFGSGSIYFGSSLCRNWEKEKE
jgi:hypothetical protein